MESGFEPRAPFVERRRRLDAADAVDGPPAIRRHTASPVRPERQYEAGIKHLKSLMDHLPLHLALAAYNAGEGAVQRFRGVPPYPETQKYVSTILALLVQ